MKEGGAVNASLAMLGEGSDVKLKLPHIELKDLGADEGGMTMGLLIQTVVQAILDVAAKSSAGFSPALAGFLKGQLKGLDQIHPQAIGKATATVEKLVGKMTEKLDKLPVRQGTAVNQQSDKLLKGMGGLLGGEN